VKIGYKERNTHKKRRNEERRIESQSVMNDHEVSFSLSKHFLPNFTQAGSTNSCKQNLELQLKYSAVE
jgi:hypothetical protein